MKKNKNTQNKTSKEKIDKNQKNNINEEKKQVMDNKEKTEKSQEVAEQKTIENLEEALKQEKEKYLRLYADFENFRKRTAKEKLELFETASENLMKELLPVVDDFERALNEIQREKDDALYKGVVLIYEKLKNTLKKSGLKDVKVEKGDVFNPETHEAIAQVPGDEKMKGKIIDVVEKGYAMGNKTIRFPKVVTGK